MNDNESTTRSAEPVLEAGTYEVLRDRLAKQSERLRDSLTQLDKARQDLFGKVEMGLSASERVTTEHHCVARDIISIGESLLLGFNVHFGLKSSKRPEDVFAHYIRDENGFHERPIDELLGDEAFGREFEQLFRYYKDTKFAKFAVIGPHLFMVFRSGRAQDDIKTFKWTIDGSTLRYEGNRSDHEFRFPDPFDFEWTRTHRDLHRSGTHPHVAIEDRVFVETVGGDLTIKVEDNTDSGEGIYSEPVENADQTLDDADIFYAALQNLILLKVKPYQEEETRTLVVSEKTQKAFRVDSAGLSCLGLPSDQGVIFPQGLVLQSGDVKLFDQAPEDLIFERRLSAPNGEDFLYAFYHRESGQYWILIYNIIEQACATPIACHGFTFLPDGDLVLFRSDVEARRHHALQIWRTPFSSQLQLNEAAKSSFLGKIGNKDLVKGMAECRGVLRLLEKGDIYPGLYVDIVDACRNVLDSYFWVKNEEAFALGDHLTAIQGSSDAAIAEFEKVIRARKDTESRFEEVEQKLAKVERELKAARFESIQDFVDGLSHLRTLRGEIITLRDLRYADLDKVEALDQIVRDKTRHLADHTVQFLLDPKALAPYDAAVHDFEAAVPQLKSAKEGEDLQESIQSTAEELEMLIETFNNLQIDDTTIRTRILDDVSSYFTSLNQVRAKLSGRLKEIRSLEGTAEFGAQLKVISQSVVNYLDLAETPGRCDQYLTKLMVSLEELEGRFAEFDEFVEVLGEKRQEVYDAFESRKLALVERRNRKTDSLRKTAERLLKGVETRVTALESIEEIHGTFASDLMIEKVRKIIDQLLELDDTVKADEVQSRLKALQETAVRELKDRSELYADGENTLRLGRHAFLVNRQALDLTTVHREDEMLLHLVGTNLFEPIEDEGFVALREFWNQESISENDEVYRAEFLAFLWAHESPVKGSRLDLASDEEALLESIREFMAPRYEESYVKGVHDHDAAKIAHAYLQMRHGAGHLLYPSQVRALVRYHWFLPRDEEAKNALRHHATRLARVRKSFPHRDEWDSLSRDVRGYLVNASQNDTAFKAGSLELASDYLCQALLDGGKFVWSGTAIDLSDSLSATIDKRESTAIRKDWEANPQGALEVLRHWIESLLDSSEEPGHADLRSYIDEAALSWLEPHGERKDASLIERVELRKRLSGLLGSHDRIQEGQLDLDLLDFESRLNRFQQQVIPRYREYLEVKKQVLEAAKQRLRLKDFQPRVLSSFVRNQLLDDVFLPLIGDNFAKQMGAAGDAKRTDSMGLLLLVSPPGYGKTTLMEYVANRLGLTFVKIDGPSISHHVTSLDPEDAPNASAREEVMKLNLAFEMGDNVMVYLDDIQHLSPEFLQKFISLCDAQRKIEGVYRGRPKTFDLRGRKVCVVMAGNPYTESGVKFQIPDMLANRADTYNLGDILGSHEKAFELSYIENCLTSNPVLQPLSRRSQVDVRAMAKLADTGEREGVEFEGTYGADELDEFLNVLRKLLRIRDVVLTVNSEYIRSAAQADAYRTEPPFKLQGSYRNMNKMAEKVLAIMDDGELEDLIMSHYESEAQTLTTGAEANLLKLKEMLGKLGEVEQSRWSSIKETFQRNLRLSGFGGDDKVAQVVDQLEQFGEGLKGIEEAVSNFDRGETSKAKTLAVLDGLVERLSQRSTPESAGVAKSAEVRVINKVPAAIHEVIHRQFQLLDSWVGPVVDALNQSDGRFKKVDEQLRATRKDYERLLAQLEEARDKDEADEEEED